MVDIKDISKKIGRKQILSECSLQLHPGRFTVVVGPNGAGKSTLLKIISGEDKDFSGEVTLNGTPVRKYKSKDLSRRRAILPQQTVINFPFTVEQVVRIGRYAHVRCTPKENDQAISEAIYRTGLDDLRERMYHTLSGGEKQRVQMARVMCQIDSPDPAAKFLLLDEPTSSLDMAQQHHLLSVAKEMCRQQTGVMAILHDLNLAMQYADEILLLKEGKTMASGPLRETISAEIIEETFGYPVQLIRYDGQSVIIPHHKEQKQTLTHINATEGNTSEKIKNDQHISFSYNG